MTSGPRITCNLPRFEHLVDCPKADLRRILLARRAALSTDLRQRWDKAISAHVLLWWQANRPPMLGVYWALQSEPDLQAVYAELAANGVQLALPVVLEKDAPLAFASWQPGEAMGQDKMKVPIPAQLRLLPRPPALLVPCLGYNSLRLRLGYGGGFYDRTLAETTEAAESAEVSEAARPARTTTIGIGYACMAAQFAGDPHDIALDCIITEAGLV
jgi:5-formyltetrahydrofolate cyclo-ligase